MWIYKNTRYTKEFYKDTLKKIKKNWNHTNHIFMETCNDNKCLIKQHHFQYTIQRTPVTQKKFQT